MIHANELMAGDYLRVNCAGRCIKKGTIVEVRGIDADNTFRFGELIGSATCHPLDDTQFDGGIWCDYLDPIPLTPEILEKNGFKRVKYGYGWKEHIGGYTGQITSSTTPIEIMYYDEGHCVVSNPHIGRMFQGSIDGVHELQHCLKLCGINKTIKL